MSNSLTKSEQDRRISSLEDKVRRLENEINSLRSGIEILMRSSPHGVNWSRSRFEQSQRELNNTLQNLAYQMNPELMFQHLQEQLDKWNEEDKKKNNETTSTSDRSSLSELSGETGD